MGAYFEVTNKLW